jgi:hypothetical protein
MPKNSKLQPFGRKNDGNRFQFGAAAQVATDLLWRAIIDLTL